MHDDLSEVIREYGEKIVAVTESAKSAHRRISEVGEFTSSVNKLAQEVARMAEKVEQITDRLDKNIERIEVGQKAQGERIGSVERAILSIAHSEKVLEEHEKRLDAIEKEPGTKWEKAIWIIITGIITAIVAFFMASLLKGGQ